LYFISTASEELQIAQPVSPARAAIVIIGGSIVFPDTGTRMSGLSTDESCNVHQLRHFSTTMFRLVAHDGSTQAALEQSKSGSTGKIRV
jgi:hypothetical protein